MSPSITTYLSNIFIISVIGIITEAIVSASGKESKTLENALKLVFSLCLTISVIIPGAEILKNTNISEVFEITDNKSFIHQEQEVINLTRKRLEADISKIIHDKFGIKPTLVCIEFVTEQNDKEINVSIESVNVVLPEENNDKIFQINEYTKSLLGLNYTQDGEKTNGTY